MNQDQLPAEPVPPIRPQALAAAFALLAVVLLAALVVLVQRSNHERDRALARKQHSFNIVLLTSETGGALARAEAALGRFVSDGDRRTGTIYADEWRRAGLLLDQLAGMTRDNPEQEGRVTELQQLYRQRGTELAAPTSFAVYRQGWQALSLYSQAGRRPTLPRIARRLREVADAERALLDERATRADDSVMRSNALAGLLSAVGALLAVSVGAALWLAVTASAGRRAARERIEAEVDRAEALERAVAERTEELSAANRRLTEEAAERAAAEAKLRQIQKLEAVGQLTGGIAHDFNNMLAVVLGGLELARKRLADGPGEAARHLDNALEGANRASALTRRLLSFARSEPLLPSGVDPGRLMHGMAELVDRTIGEAIEVRIVAQRGVWPVWVDRYQLENAILNLCVNARDAMGGAGLLRMEAGNVALGAGQVGTLPAGDYVRVAVADNGRGMSPAVLERVFEPFFTTKPVGAGTGLGLSQLFGFARQSGGEVQIQSTEGLGTVVSLYLPRHLGEAGVEAAEASASPAAAGGGDTVLVVEDDARVRAATVEALTELGYQPLACGSGAEALGVLAARPDVRLLVTDVLMPGMTGPELVRQACVRFPRLRVVFVTGYVGEAGEADQFAGHGVLRKPFTIAALAAATAQALATPAADPITERAA